MKSKYKMTDLEKQKEDNDKWSGTIELDDKFVIFKSKGKEISKFLMSDIKIIGEMTTQDGPCANDWDIIFFCQERSTTLHTRLRQQHG